VNAEHWLPIAWFGVIGFAVLMYVLLDGFVLGLGILMPFADDEVQRDRMMSTAAPIWDGNETWLGLWPNLLPPSLSIWQAAAPPSSQGFVLAGLVVILPVVLGYTWWSYRVFRGKVGEYAGYHD
jgi:cytochrome bd-type quinol oxidase subunit 2